MLGQQDSWKAAHSAPQALGGRGGWSPGGAWPGLWRARLEFLCLGLRPGYTRGTCKLVTSPQEALEANIGSHNQPLTTTERESSQHLFESNACDRSCCHLRVRVQILPAGPGGELQPALGEGRRDGSWGSWRLSLGRPAAGGRCGSGAELAGAGTLRERMRAPWSHGAPAGMQTLGACPPYLVCMQNPEQSSQSEAPPVFPALRGVVFQTCFPLSLRLPLPCPCSLEALGTV